jgi:hypothetical protein
MTGGGEGSPGMIPRAIRTSAKESLWMTKHHIRELTNLPGRSEILYLKENSISGIIPVTVNQEPPLRDGVLGVTSIRCLAPAFDTPNSAPKLVSVS